MKIITLLAKIGLAIIAVLFCLFIIFIIIAIGASVIVPKLSKAVDDAKSDKQTEIVQEVVPEVATPEVVPEPKVDKPEESTTMIVTIKDLSKKEPLGYMLRDGCSTKMEIKVSPNTNKCLNRLEEYCNMSLEGESGTITDGFGKEYHEYFKEGKINSKCELIPDPITSLSQDQIMFKMRDIGGTPDDIWLPEWQKDFKNRCKIQSEFKMYYNKLTKKNKAKFKDHELLTLNCKVKTCSDWFSEYLAAENDHRHLEMPDDCKEEYADQL